MTKEYLFQIQSNKFLASITTLIFFLCYFIYPVWTVPGTFFWSFISLTAIIWLGIFLFVIVYNLTPNFVFNIPKFHLKDVLTCKKRHFLFIFILITLIYIIVLIPSLNDGFTARGDEGWHVRKITYLATFFSYNRIVPFLYVWAIILLSMICILSFIIWFSQSNITTKKELNENKKKLWIFGLICSILLSIIGSLIYVDSNRGFFTMFNRQKLIRFGPIHPLTSQVIFLLFPWNDFALKSYSTILIILSSFIISQIYLELSTEKNIINQIFALLTAMTFLFFPVVITYASLVYLTAGVVFFFTLTTYTLIKYTKTLSRSYLNYTFILMGIGYLWKTVHLFCAFGVGLSLIILLLSQERSIWKSTFQNYIYSGMISLVFIIPWSILSINPELYTSQDLTRFDPSLLLTNALFDYFSRATVEMGVIGVWCYSMLVILFFWSLIKKRIDLLALTLIFIIWYFVFSMDIGWSHDVDRFMVPGLSILALSPFLCLGEGIRTLKNNYPKENLAINYFTRHRLIQRFVTVVVIFGSLGFAAIVGPNLQSGEPNKFVYLPIDDLAFYIAQNTNSSDVIYLGITGATPVSFYLQKYHSQATFIYSIWASIEEQNLTNFLNYLHSEHVKLFVFSSWGNWDYYSSQFIDELLQNPNTNEIQLIKQIGKNETLINIWKVL